MLFTVGDRGKELIVLNVLYHNVHQVNAVEWSPYKGHCRQGQEVRAKCPPPSVHIIKSLLVMKLFSSLFANFLCSLNDVVIYHF